MLFGTFQDITKQKQTEQALKESESKFRTFFNMLPVQATITQAKDGKILDINHYNEIFNNFKKEDLIGKIDTKFG